MASSKFRVSRVTSKKSNANWIFRWWKKHGATALKISSYRSLWKVSAWMPISEYATFCSEEAQREKARPSPSTTGR